MVPSSPGRRGAGKAGRGLGFPASTSRVWCPPRTGACPLALASELGPHRHPERCRTPGARWEQTREPDRRRPRGLSSLSPESTDQAVPLLRCLQTSEALPPMAPTPPPSKPRAAQPPGPTRERSHSEPRAGPRRPCHTRVGPGGSLAQDVRPSILHLAGEDLPKVTPPAQRWQPPWPPPSGGCRHGDSDVGGGRLQGASSTAPSTRSPQAGLTSLCPSTCRAPSGCPSLGWSEASVWVTCASRSQHPCPASGLSQAALALPGAHKSSLFWVPHPTGSWLRPPPSSPRGGGEDGLWSGQSPPSPVSAKPPPPGSPPRSPLPWALSVQASVTNQLSPR